LGNVGGFVPSGAGSNRNVAPSSLATSPLKVITPPSMRPMAPSSLLRSPATWISNGLSLNTLPSNRTFQASTLATPFSILIVRLTTSASESASLPVVRSSTLTANSAILPRPLTRVVAALPTMLVMPSSTLDSAPPLPPSGIVATTVSTSNVVMPSALPGSSCQTSRWMIL